MKRLATKTRFRIGAASILLIICTSVAAVVYLYLKNLATERIYRETELFVATADATRTYVKDMLRPQMEAMLPKDTFVPQAMSTSYVGRQVMSRLRRRFPDFSYKRAALDPVNPINKADPLERKMLQWFAEHPQRKEWHGLINRENRSYYARFRAIYAEAECLRCHGDPADAPAQMLEIYGTSGGFYYRSGDVVAADTIYIPVDVTFVRVKEAAWNVFLMAAVSLVAVLGLFYLFFNRTVISEMKGLLGRFSSIREMGAAAEDPPAVAAGDEFDQVKHAFEQVAEDLRDAHQRLKASEVKYRSLFETSREPILICDDQNRLRDINPAGCLLFGFADRSEALSIETFFQLFWDTRQAGNFQQQVVRDGHVDGMEAEMVNRHGNKLLTLVSAAGRKDTDGRLSRIDILVLQSKEVRPLGAASGHRVDVRILAATNQDLEARIAENRFRQDLYYRLNVAAMVMPALRTIAEDTPLLTDHFLEKAAGQHKQPKKTVTVEVMNRLLSHPWPGNIRQLENMVHTWYALTPETVIEERHIAADATCPAPASAAPIHLSSPYRVLKERAVDNFTQAYLETLLTHSRGNISLAAQLSGMKRQSLQKIIRRCGLDPDRFRTGA